MSGQRGRGGWARGSAVAVCCAGVAGVAVAALRFARRNTGPAPVHQGLGRGVTLRGTVWPGGAAEPFDGVVVVAPDGTIAELAPAGAVRLPADLPVLGGPRCWIGPGLIDAHVHLAFGSRGDELRGGLVAVRDLGAPPSDARRWRTTGRPPAGSPAVAVAGPVITAPGGYPSRSWGADGFAAFADSPRWASAVVRDLAADGVDLIKIALEPGAGWPVPSPAAVRGLVEAAHGAGLRVTAHALTAGMVDRALDAGVDELCHTPTERLADDMIERVAVAGIPVVSTLQTFFSAGQGSDAARNAAALHRAGVRLLYGTDLGNTGTRSGIDPRELDRLADTGLGRVGALRAATEGAATAYGVRGRTGRLTVGEPAALVLLSADPLVEPGAWRAPLAVVADGRLIRA
jgi:imidazolonepropionase-like amidohydrolase